LPEVSIGFLSGGSVSSINPTEANMDPPDGWTIVSWTVTASGEAVLGDPEGGSGHAGLAGLPPGDYRLIYELKSDEGLFADVSRAFRIE
jgi:hypothetical protein